MFSLDASVSAVKSFNSKKSGKPFFVATCAFLGGCLRAFSDKPLTVGTPVKLTVSVGLSADGRENVCNVSLDL